MGSSSAKAEFSLEQGRRLRAGGHLYAALEQLNDGVKAQATLSGPSLGTLYDELGVLHVAQGATDRALAYFIRAVETSEGREQALRFSMHLALMYRRQCELDKALRLLSRLISEAGSGTPTTTLALLYGNLGLVQGYNNYHREALQSSLTCLSCLQNNEDHHYLPDVLTNIGHHLLQLHRFDEAQEYLLRAQSLAGFDYLPAKSELCRLYYRAGRFEDATAIALTLLDGVWSSGFSLEKEEIAQVCELLAFLARDAGRLDLAVRLLEKAQLLFGQIRLWREWQRTQVLLDTWHAELASPCVAAHADAFVSERMEEFVTLLDALHAQEVIHPKFGQLLDVRVQYARSLAELSGLPQQDQAQLVLACRLADFGLTALEPDVIASPRRSEAAWRHYAGHPELSLRLLDRTQLPHGVRVLIRDHHLPYDANSPTAPTGPIETATGVDTRSLFSIADAYADAVVLREVRHSDALASVCKEAGKAYDPRLAAALSSLFDV
ncbi:MAG: hypothetical protein OWU32_00565 [Firmicutes bacterium]|nr:hypothetical protein [Bacillota bacterium]